MRGPGVTAAALVLTAAFGLSAWADDEKIPLDKLPAPVLKAIKAKFPGAKLEEAVKEVEDGMTTYEVELTHKDVEYTVALKPDGTIEEIEREVEIEDLPDTVLAALKAKYPKAKLTEAVEVIAGEKPHTFEVMVQPKGKKAREVVLNAKGRILKDGEDKDDDDDDEKGEKKDKGEKKEKNDK